MEKTHPNTSIERPVAAARDPDRPAVQIWIRGAFLALLAGLELPLLAFLFDPLAINHTSENWRAARTVLREAVPLALFFFAGLAIIIAPQWRRFASEWRAAAERHQFRPPLIANLALFAVMAVLTVQFNAIGAAQDNPPWELFILWCLGALAPYLFLAGAAAPLSYWRQVVNRERALIALAAGAALFVETAAVLSRQSWNALSDATFTFSAFLLRLYEQEVAAFPETRIIHVGDFKVNIAAACSGYEGVGLVVTFLAIYLWIFRSVLRFPNAFLLVPFGAIAIWLLNSVRIALLVSIGAHISPDIAITGFHSQAGWMMFLIVTIGIMVAAHRSSFFHDAASAKPAKRRTGSGRAPCNRPFGSVSRNDRRWHFGGGVFQWRALALCLAFRRPFHRYFRVFQCLPKAFMAAPN